MSRVTSHKMQFGDKLQLANQGIKIVDVILRTSMDTEISFNLCINSQIEITAGKESVEIILNDSDADYDGLKLINGE